MGLRTFPLQFCEWTWMDRVHDQKKRMDYARESEAERPCHSAYVALYFYFIFLGFVWLKGENPRKNFMDELHLHF